MTVQSAVADSLSQPQPLPAAATSSISSACASLNVLPYYDPELFTAPPPDHLLCAICTGVVHTPLNLSCSHLFCSVCLGQWCQSQSVTQAELAQQISHSSTTSGSIQQATQSTAPAATTSTSTDTNSTSARPSSPLAHPASPPSNPVPVSCHACPTCRAPFSLFLASPNHAIQHVIANMEVKCPNYELGCQATMTMGPKERNVINHRRSCPFELVACRYAPACEARVTRREMEQHERTSCTERLLRCDDCGELVKCALWDKHRNNLLGCENMVQCPHGCAPASGNDETMTDDDSEGGASKRRKRSEEEKVSHQFSDTTSSAESLLSASGLSLTSPHTHTSNSSESSRASSPHIQLLKRKHHEPLTTSNVTVLRRSELAEHLSVCPLQPIQCELCPARMQQHELPQHLASSLVQHFMALQAQAKQEKLKTELLRAELTKARAEAREARRAVTDVSRQLSSGPLFAYFFDIAPISLLCSHYISNDFVCGDHVYYFALHRQGAFFSAYLYLKTGATPVALSFVLMAKMRARPTGANSGAGGAASSSLMSEDGTDRAHSPSLSSAHSDSSMSLLSSAAPSAPTALRLKLDVKFTACEGKGIRNWFTLSDLQERGGYTPEEDAITIGILIKDHSSSWVYSAADALMPLGLAQ